MTAHLGKDFHQTALIKANNFMKTVERGNVSQTLNTTSSKYLEENKKSLKRISFAIEHHGRLGAPLRGHRDSGTLNLDSDEIDYTQGQFRPTLQLMSSCGDKILRDHLQKSSVKTYISPQSQNEIIGIIGKIMANEIVGQLKHTSFFSIMCDETQDIAGLEQLSLCVSFLNQKYEIQERFICFEVVKDMTGKGIANCIMNISQQHGLADKRCLIGQGFDGAAAMSGEKNGVQRFLQDVYPAAVYVHCSSHVLNLYLEKGSKITETNACVTTMKGIIIFFRESS